MIDKKPTKLYWQTLSTSHDFTFNISLIKWFELLSSQQKIECSLKKQILLCNHSFNFYQNQMKINLTG